ncbi:MAG TPA: LssY C-terminal domain-containing protein, partial [Gemmatimonadales bacterium]|nr:LssY C-terminal domain-containing protein [Gemmatimonadales bacterium]
RGPAARIVSGELGRIRLIQPLRVGAAHCGRNPDDTTRLADLPEFTPWSEPRNGRGAGDQMNVILLGAANDIDHAFRRAGWVGPAKGSLGSVTREIVAGITNRPAVGAPISTQYFNGRRQDLAYQLAGPTARSRHHIRLWALDTTRTIWVAAANEDAGFFVNPFKGRFTHHVRPEIDTERERVIKELEATGCATLADRVVIPGAVLEGKNASGQRFVTDGRTAVLTIRRCDAENSLAARQ